MKPNQFRRCFNCGIRIKSLAVFFIAELTDSHKKILAQWTQEQLPDNGSICDGCYRHIKYCENDDNPPRAVGHEQVCAGCGNSVFKKRFRAYSTEELISFLLFMDHGYNHYKHYKTGEYLLCRPCQQRSQRYKNKVEVKEINANTKPLEKLSPNQKQLKHPQVYNTQVYETNSDTKTSEPIENVAPPLNPFKQTQVYYTQVARFEDDFLILPGFHKFPLKRHKCALPKCQKERQLLSKAQRKLIFLQTNSLLEKRSGLCIYHRQFKNWSTFGIQNFTKLAVEEAISILEKPVAILDFDRINDMPDHLCKYWTGLTADKFKALYEKLNVDTSKYHSLRNALAVYLLRQKTGDSLLKLANLFLMTTCTLSKQLMIIEKSFETYNSNKTDE